MKKTIAALAGCLTLAIGLALVTTAAAADAKGAKLKVGDKAPNFKLKGTDGKTYELAKFKGKQAVVVAWYPKAKTGG